jgi:hypothetical protein
MRGREGSPGGVGYPPFDTLKPVADNIFIVDSLLPGALGKVVAPRMTVIRLTSGELLLHSPTRFTDGLRRELAALGRIRHLLAPNLAHWSFLPSWQHHVPGAITWAAPGLRRRTKVRRGGLRLDQELEDTTPPEWGDTVALVTVPGGMGFHEATLFHRPTRTLVLTDLVVNLEPQKLPGAMRPVVRLLGSMAPDGRAPLYLQAVIRRRHRAAAEAASRLLALAPERVIFAHGRWFEQDGTAALRRSLRWLLP